MRVSAAKPLTFAERVALASEIVVSYIVARRDLKSAPIADVVAALRRSDGRRRAEGALPPGDGVERSSSDMLVRASRLARAVVAMLALFPGDSRCLVRSLVLTRLLARREIPSRLVIGARTAPEFLAHAWVECAGAPVLDPGDGSFGRLVEL